MKKYKSQILFLAAACIMLGWFALRIFSCKNNPAVSEADTTVSITARITTSENIFTAEQVGKIKRVLIDSLQSVYGKRINSLLAADDQHTPLLSQYSSSVVDSENLQHAYCSEVDTFFIAVDDSGFVSDSINVRSAFISSMPLADNCIHLVDVFHKSFNKETVVVRTITKTKISEEKKSFFERFKIIPNVSAGYGYFHKQFDVYGGVGITFEF